MVFIVYCNLYSVLFDISIRQLIGIWERDNQFFCENLVQCKSMHSFHSSFFQTVLQLGFQKR